MPLTYENLPESDRPRYEVHRAGETVTVEGEPMFLYCRSCGGRFSATRSDYFMRDPDEPVICGECDEPMILAREKTTIVDECGMEV